MELSIRCMENFYPALRDWRILAAYAREPWTILLNTGRLPMTSDRTCGAPLAQNYSGAWTPDRSAPGAPEMDNDTLHGYLLRNARGTGLSPDAREHRSGGVRCRA